MPSEESAEDRELLDWASKDVYRGCERKDWEPWQLPVPLVVYWAVEQAVEKINNGGLQYFFENDWPGQPPYIVFIGAFRTIGARETANWLEDAVEKFPFPEPHKDYQARRDYMNKRREQEGKYETLFDRLSGRIMDLCGENYTRLAAYVRENIEAFPTAKKR